MPTIGPLELAIVLIIALVAVGPARLPGLGRSVGRGIRELRTSLAVKGDDAGGGDREPPPGDRPAPPYSGAS